MSPTQYVIDATSVPTKWHLNPSNGLSRGHDVSGRGQADGRQTDRQTSRYAASFAA